MGGEDGNGYKLIFIQNTKANTTIFITLQQHLDYFKFSCAKVVLKAATVAIAFTPYR